MAVIIPVASKFDDSGIKKAKSAFGGLANSLKSTLGAIGLSASLAGVVSALKEASKAAVSDTKSQALLANQLKNTVGATDSAIAATEDFISALELETSIADDSLRPALSTLVRATGDVSSAQKLLALSTDIAAGTGKDLSAVSGAVAKAAAGQTTQLFRLIPSLRGSADWASAAALQFEGMAAAAANNDPYQQMEVIFGRIQEQVGMALLPSLQDFSAWLASPETQNALKFIIDGFNGWIASMKNTVDGANAVGQALVNVLNIDPNVAGKAWNGFFNGLGRSIANLVGGPAGNLLFTLLNLLGGGGKKETISFTPTTFTPTDFSGIDFNSGTKIGGSKKKTKAEIAKEEANKAKERAKAALAAIQKELKGLSAGFEPLTQATSTLGEFQQGVVDTFTEINKKIAEGVANKTFGTKGLSNLRNFLKAQQNLLEENARQRDAIIQKRSLAKALFDEVSSALLGTGNLAGLLETQTRQVTQSVTKIVDGFTVTTKRTVDEVVGGKGVISRLKEVVAKTKAFAQQLTSLKAAGLSPDLFKQIVDAGPDVGGQLATEILAGGADSVTALNDTFKELQTVTEGVAEQTAVVMFNAGVEVAGGLVNGLLAQEAALVAAAKTLADAFNAAYQAQIMELTIPEAPKVTPKTPPKKTTVIVKNTIKATPNTKADAQRTIASINKYATASGYGLLNAKFL